MNESRSIRYYYDYENIKKKKIKRHEDINLEHNEDGLVFLWSLFFLKKTDQRIYPLNDLTISFKFVCLFIHVLVPVQYFNIPFITS